MSSLQTAKRNANNVSGDTTAQTILQSSIDESFQEVVSSSQRGRRQNKVIEKEKK